jgi:hypothetical protein
MFSAIFLPGLLRVAEALTDRLELTEIELAALLG